jgi:hypothetical protein
MSTAQMARRGERGQTLVLVALLMTVLLASTAVAVDGGRFYSERRFLQNVADAGALAAATAMTQGRTEAEAEAIARQTISLNLAHEPTNSAAVMPSMVPIYEPGHVGDPSHLVEGIVINAGEVRVAVRNPVDYTFGRIVGLVEQDISAHARAGYQGGLLPIAVRQYLVPPGPTEGATTPCGSDDRRFTAVFATVSTACVGSDTDPSGRADPSAGGLIHDPSSHGPMVAILGQGSAPDNASDFRGFIALDIRNFATPTSQRYYNGVTAGTNANSLKASQSEWILRGGYPGPAFPPITYPPDPNNQVAILSGNSSGHGVDALADRYRLGDEILINVYPGYVMAIPDFSLTAPGRISLPVDGEVTMAGSFKVSRNQAFTGSVTLSTLPDLLDPLNPLTLGTLDTDDGSPIDYSPNPVSPSLGQGATVQMRNIETDDAAPGIYALWVKAQAGSPYLTSKLEPLAVKIGDIQRDFILSADATGKVAQNFGDTVTFSLLLTDHPNRNISFGGPVTLSVDAPLPSGTGAVSLSSTSAIPSKNGTAVTLSINTGTLPQGDHRFVVRATGMNGDSTPGPVTHLLPLTVNVAPSGTPGNDEYIDLTGWAVMRVSGISSNSIEAYAITPVITDLDDPRLRRGQQARLLPW